MKKAQRKEVKTKTGKQVRTQSPTLLFKSEQNVNKIVTQRGVAAKSTNYEQRKIVLRKYHKTTALLKLNYHF